MTKAEADAWVAGSKLDAVPELIQKRVSFWHSVDRKLWPLIKVTKRAHFTFDNLLVEEKVLEIKLPWKSKFWDSSMDTLEKQRRVFLLAWYKPIQAAPGYRIRVGLA